MREKKAYSNEKKSNFELLKYTSLPSSEIIRSLLNLEFLNSSKW